MARFPPARMYRSNLALFRGDARVSPLTLKENRHVCSHDPQRLKVFPAVHSGLGGARAAREKAGRIRALPAAIVSF